ncbi:MAG: DUF4440 domain-containing protein [Terracidiphilus sp.]
MHYPVRMNVPEGTEPELTTAPKLQSILAELIRREPIVRNSASPARFREHDGGGLLGNRASGRRYFRQFILDELEKRFPIPHADIWETSDFQCRRFGEDTYLLTYTLLEDHVRLTRRSTIWRRTPTGWKIVYHQGTIVQDA